MTMSLIIFKDGMATDADRSEKFRRSFDKPRNWLV